MTPTLLPPSRRGVAVLLAVALLLALAAPAAPAADGAVAVPAIVPAFELTDIVHDRKRLVQCSVLAVALGIAILWIGQKT